MGSISNYYKSRKKEWYFFIPILLFSSITPLIVYLKVVPLDKSTSELFLNQKYGYDFFSYYKSLLIIISGFSGFVVYIIWSFNNTLKRTIIYIPMLSYCIFIILSTVFSQNKKISLHGFYNIYEGMFVLLSYLVIMFITINFVQSKKDFKYILSGIIISSSLICLIGLFQYFGQDIFKLNIGKKLILPYNYHRLLQSLNFSFGKYTIYSTLSNSNYVGTYMAMLFPISIGLFIYVDKRRLKVLSLLYCCLIFSNLIGSRSLAGLIGGFIGLTILLIFLRKILYENIYWLRCLCLMCIVIFLVMFLNTKGDLSEKIITLYKADRGNVEKIKPIKDIKLSNNILEIKTSREVLYVLTNNKNIIFKDSFNNNLNVEKYNENKYIITDNRYSGFSIDYNPTDKILTLNNKDTTIKLLVDNDYNFKLINYKGEEIDVEYIPAFGFNGKEKFASGRGYIWSRSIPLLMDTLLFGYGPDNYVLYFPQNDTLGKYKVYGTDSMIINKPHNMYLQVGVNTGVASLMSVLIMFIIYIFSSTRMYLKTTENSFYNILGVSIFSSFCSYMIVSLANDSVVSVAPLFWTLFGLGIGTNLNNKNSLMVINNHK